CYTVEGYGVEADASFWLGRRYNWTILLYPGCPDHEHFCSSSPVPVEHALGVECMLVEYRSVSQVKELEDCGYRYYLSRQATDEDGNRLWRRPAAWLPQGLGVHKAAETFEKSGRAMTLEEVQKVYSESYDEETNKLLEETPDLSWWFRSGPYNGAQDIPRRYRIGLEQTARYVRYYTEIRPDEKPLRLDDQNLAVE